MIDDTKRIGNLMQEISEVIPHHIDIYLIGGGAMMYLGSKQYTKDLDLVVSSEEEYRTLSDALTKLGFVSNRPTAGMRKANLSDTQERGEYR